MCPESRTKPLAKPEDYRSGSNAKYARRRSVPIVYDVAHDKMAGSRAPRIAPVIIRDVARNGDYRVNEHL